MDPFADLPAPKHEAKQPEATTTAAQPADVNRPGKRQRTEEAGTSYGGPAAAAEAEAAAAEGADAQAAAPAAADPEDPPPPPPMPADQVAPALLKIANHISNPSKFAKAAGLLRQLIAGGAVGAAHRAALFAALTAAFSDPTRADDPALRREYRRLLNAFTNGVPPDVFSPAQGAHFEVYGIWVMQRGELATDDSFVFNKVRAAAGGGLAVQQKQ
jgi:hypothetical protein